MRTRVHSTPRTADTHSPGAKTFFQPKLSVNLPNDRIMRTPANMQDPFFPPVVPLITSADTTPAIQRDEDESPVAAPEGNQSAEPSADATISITMPQPLVLSVNGVGVSYPTMYIQGNNGTLIDIAPYMGNGAIDFPLAALEALGIPILSYFAFHGGPLTAYRGRRFSHAYGLSGGTSFIRNALHYGYLQADETDLYGAPSSYSPEHYAAFPDLRLHANPMDIGTMINVSYFNNPLGGAPNNPTILFSVTAPFDTNPLEAITNLGNSIAYLFSGDLYRLPGVTHNYPDFRSNPTNDIK